jgi:ribonuclease VapC
VILDSSAVLAVLTDEPTSHRLTSVIERATVVGIGAPTVLETAMVLTSRIGLEARTLLARFLDEAGAEVIPFTTPHADEALDAFERFGKGRHPAGLNFGDCMSYAVARLAGVALLCTGDDFARTDAPLVSW